MHRSRPIASSHKKHTASSAPPQSNFLFRGKGSSSSETQTPSLPIDSKCTSNIQHIVNSPSSEDVFHLENGDYYKHHHIPPL